MKNISQTPPKYPFPWRIFFAYFLSCAGEIVLLDAFAVMLVRTNAFANFFFSLLSFALTLVVYGVLIAVLAFVLYLSRGKKIYRGNALYKITFIVSALCPVAFLALVLIMRFSERTYTFFNYTILFLECTVPILATIFVLAFTHRCRGCGNINAFKILRVKVDELSKEHKFHNEGGVYNRWGGFYVPKTVVYDGQFEKRRTATDYTCTVCGKSYTHTQTTETKIGE